MARLNTPRKTTAPKHTTFEGAPASRITAEQQLRRLVMANMLWEGQFYIDGASTANLVELAVQKVKPEKVVEIAIQAREQMKLRHIPLLLARELARGDKEAKGEVAHLLHRIIQRPDELTEFLAIYWAGKRTPLSAQVKKGLALAFTKFDEYSLAKYNRESQIKLRDVLFLTHAKPKDKVQADLWKRLVDDALAIPDTWEVTLSAGGDKKANWTRLLKEEKLFALALVRNLRNMVEAGVDDADIRKALKEIKTERVLPFRFISAAKHAPKFEPELETAMFKCVADRKKLKGKTVLLIDGSGSMEGGISGKSELRRFDAACGLGILLREICDDVQIFVFSNTAVHVPPRRGFALRDSMKAAAEWGGTETETAKKAADKEGYDRLIILTDEQSHQALSKPVNMGYIINVAAYEHGIGYGAWHHVDGWSEAIIDYIEAVEDSGQGRVVKD